MKVLVLGGTRFVGRGIVEATLNAKHDVTLFNRGTDRAVFPSVHRIIGDRTKDAAKLAAQDWDCVVDVSGYRPSEVRPVARAVHDRTQHYVYISTVSVYATPMPPGAGEDAPLMRVDASIPDTDPRSYGGLKALCESALRASLGDRLTVLRPTVVVGPHDYTNRFTWWVQQIARDGKLPVPDRLHQHVQLIDVRDLAAFVVRVVEERILGTFNTVGPREPLTLSGMIDVTQEAIAVHVELVSADDEHVATSHHFPLVRPDSSDDSAYRVSGNAAYGAGLTLRPLVESARAVLN